MLNLLILGQNWVKIYFSGLARTYNIPDNLLIRYENTFMGKRAIRF